MSERTGPRALVAVAASLLVPWSVQVYDSGYVSLLFAWGSATPGTGSVTTLFDFLVRYTAGLPGWVSAWPIASLLATMALASALAGVRLGREDVRVTGGLLALAGVGVLWVSWGFSYQSGRVALPVGTAALWAVSLWVYLPLVRDRAVGTAP